MTCSLYLGATRFPLVFFVSLVLEIAKSIKGSVIDVRARISNHEDVFKTYRNLNNSSSNML
jgi:hypothetical protein